MVKWTLIAVYNDSIDLETQVVPRIGEQIYIDAPRGTITTGIYIVDMVRYFPLTDSIKVYVRSS